MTTQEQLIQELEHASEDLLQVVLQFVLSAKQTAHCDPIVDVPIVSEPTDRPVNGIQTLLDLLDSMPLTPEEIASSPHDGAENHDHYLYGAPKKSA